MIIYNIEETDNVLYACMHSNPHRYGTVTQHSWDGKDSLTVVAPLLFRILAPSLTHLRVTDNTGVLAVEEDVYDVLFFEFAAFEDVF